MLLPSIDIRKDGDEEEEKGASYQISFVHPNRLMMASASLANIPEKSEKPMLR